MSLSKLPSLTDRCSEHFAYRDLIECGETWAENDVDNIPRDVETYNALQLLATTILDPIVNQFGSVEITYGFAGPKLTRLIRSRIAPELDQHASFETNDKGQQVCVRGGAACDLLVKGESSVHVASWIVRNLGFDRLYFYGEQAPIHVSVSEKPTRKCTFMARTSGGRTMPRTYSDGRFLEILSDL